jgi:ribosome-associated heat shock protein Hsp15
LQRVDKWLWFARFFKSRTLAAEMVTLGRVRLNGERCEKASQNVRQGDVLTFAAGSRVRVVKVLGDGARRGPASEARTLYEDLSPAEQGSEWRNAAGFERDQGAGRPTKKERRAIDRLRDSADEG